MVYLEPYSVIIAVKDRGLRVPFLYGLQHRKRSNKVAGYGNAHKRGVRCSVFRGGVLDF